MQSKKKQFFTQSLLEWFAHHHRPLPWKGEKNPYLIWLSEIILQQTRVEQGLPYFERFKEKYPTIEDLANAPEDEVMKLWEGLGYYSRARNLHFTAKFISNQLKGVFPTSHKNILALKGVGAYTAAAIASFAYDLPYAVVDGNVYRVLARFFGIEEPIDTTAGKKQFAALAQDLLDKTQAANYNQAIMDFGATHCMPKTPKCNICSMQIHCQAYQKNKVALLPIKSKKMVKKERYFNYLIFHFSDETTLVKKRIEKDIWQNLYDFPLIELDKSTSDRNIIQQSEIWKACIQDADFSIKKISKPFQQVLTHRKIIATFWEIDVNSTPSLKRKNYVIVKRKNMFKFAFPKIIDLYFQDKSLYLDLF